MSTTTQVIFNFPADKLSNSQQLFVRYSNGSVSQVPYNSGASSATFNNPEGKTIVGGYVSDGTFSWVPDYSYSQTYGSTVIVSGFNVRKLLVYGQWIRHLSY
ncbi:hypothetical protein HQN89_03835 [Paenibacillus frigoriresistens]|uniref:hypothetical protein n=1 Tax=Paenibacillus alginolyticus TaxID=59839 RepID=UPI001566A03D|nr:hypothetical protein [Paenibacillus frigoriresistens]NRF90166.1 hypothetical protein [Paenibacillus frigoriresistens]